MELKLRGKSLVHGKKDVSISCNFFSQNILTTTGTDIAGDVDQKAVTLVCYISGTTYLIIASVKKNVNCNWHGVY